MFAKKSLENTKNHVYSQRSRCNFLVAMLTFKNIEITMKTSFSRALKMPLKTRYLKKVYLDSVCVNLYPFNGCAFIIQE